jgi:Protein of unknown function (DUF3618)
MAETVDQIERQIDRARRDLGHNLDDLERRVDAATEWRTMVRNHPAAALAAACAGGMVLAAILPRRHSGHARRLSAAPAYGDRVEGARRLIREFVDDAEAALVTVVGQRLASYLGRWMPGFEDELTRVQSSRPGAGFAERRG